MTNPVFFINISFIILLITGILLIIIRLFKKKWNRYIPIGGILIAGCFAYYPLVDKTGEISQVVDVITKSGQMFVLNLDYGEIAAGLLKYPPNIAMPYQILLAVLNLIAPVCTAVIILSLIGDLLAYWKIGLFCFQDRHVFSHLNEKTWALAKSMKRNNVSGIFIFCGLNRMKREENPYYEEARRNECIIIDNHVVAVHPARYGFSNYYLISENGCENTCQALNLMDQFKGRKGVKIFVMSNETETEYLLDKKMKEHGKDVVNLHHINEVQFVSYDLLYQNPLFSVVLPERKKVSMLIIGSGYFGLEVLKNTLWCSRTKENYSFEVTVIDKNITNGIGQFIRSCPDLDLKEYNITFHEKSIDADTIDLIDHLEKLLEEKDECYNYIVIATNFDDTNIKAALDIRSWYQRKKYQANISVAIRDELKYDLIKKLQDDEKSETIVKIFPFACINQMYSYEKILNNPLEKMGVCVNAVYEQTYDKSQNQYIEINYANATAKWRKLILQKKRSSMALALFIKYVLWMRGYSITVSSNENMQFSESEINDYAKLEHDRWNAYQLTEGFYRWKYEDFINQENQKRKLNGENVPINARFDVGRLHACITDWDTILQMDRELGTCFAEYDREFIRNIPQIISGFTGEFKYQYGIKKI